MASVRALAVAAACLALAACGPPIRVARVSGPAAYRSITANALGSDRASEWTRTTANAWGLVEIYDDQPETALATLRDVVTSGRGGSRELFALAELSLLYGEQTGKRSYDLAAAVYAYAFLFPTDPADEPQPLDPRTRLAADIYNRAITLAFASPDGRSVAIVAGTYPLPFGQMQVTTDPAQLEWGDRRLVDLKPVAEIEVEGMRNRHRLSGLGAALVASTVPREGVAAQKSLIAPQARVAATAVLKIPNVRAGIDSGQLRGTLDLYAASATETVIIEGRERPLEIDETTAVAVQLAASPIWKQELWGFLGRSLPGFKLPVLVSLDPYRPGRIPVVFVHGTQSSPARWADMANDLLSDPWIRQRYQFWYFFYDSGNPIPYSGMLLRDALTAAVQQMDPDGRDACLHQMVVIGHSQGGLLTKFTAVDTGTALWDAVLDVPPDQLRGPPEFRELVQKALIVQPVPFVHRLVFVSTPHHGSFLTGQTINNLLRRLVRLPSTLVSLSTAMLKQSANVLRYGQTFHRLPTAVDNMTPGNPFLEAFYKVPVANGVPYHSIISVKEEFPVVEDGNDGVVEYRSAAIAGATSQLVVRSPHSCQANPHTVQEVRRILHLHGEELAAEGLRCGPASGGSAPTGSAVAPPVAPDVRTIVPASASAPPAP